MRTFRDQPIRQKLMLIIMLTTSVALLLAGASIGIWVTLTARESLARDMTLVVTNISNASTPSLVFNVPETAERVLKPLEHLPDVVSADLFTDDGRVLADYQRDTLHAHAPAVLGEPGYHYSGDFLDIYQPVQKDGRVIGTSYIRMDIGQRLRGTLTGLGLLVAVSLLASLTVAYIMSSRLQRIVSMPIRQLALLEGKVSREQDYSIRASKHGNDEVGVLIDGFNQMLAQIQIRDEELRVAKDRAEDANRTKSGFLANMSHELRTPLNGILGYSEMMMEEAGDRGEEHLIPDLQKINAAGKHLLALINDILDLSKIEAGKMELYVETVDLKSVLDDVVTTITPIVTKNGIEFEVYCASDLGIVRVDVTRLRQVLFNLLTNAAKFTEKGKVSLHVSRETADGLSWTVIRVADTGIGIAPEQMQKLFQAFSQADASTTRRYGGTGLGLVISRQICRLMNGDISFKSEPGKGSTFTARLPLERVHYSGEEAEPPAAAEPARLPVAGSNTVLIIDDDQSARELLQRLLEKEGFLIYCARDGDEGLQLARKLRPAVITLDVLMPRLDGWAVLRTLKADPLVADIPVVLASIIDNKEMGYALGAADYLTKPIDRERLVTTMAKYRRNGTASLLLIEDELQTRQMVRRALENEGWTVAEANSGSVALERIRESKPDLILLDLLMPEMNGFDFVDELHADQHWRSIPIVVLTAKDVTSEDRLKLKGHVEKILLKGNQTMSQIVKEIRDVATSRRILSATQR